MRVLKNTIEELAGFMTSATVDSEALQDNTFDYSQVSINDAMARGYITGTEAKSLAADMRKNELLKVQSQTVSD